MRFASTRTFLFFAFMTTTAAQTASVTTFTSRAAYSAATTGTKVIGFNSVLPAGTTFLGFNPLVVSGVQFSTPTTGTTVNVTTGNYYSPSDYPGAFLSEAGATPNTTTLNILLSQPTYAFALDYGQLSGAGSGTMTLSNGFTVGLSSLPTVGSTAFIGFVSNTPITGLSFAVAGDVWVVEDVMLSALPSSGPVPAISMSLSDAIVAAGESATLTWSSTNATTCSGWESWSGARTTSGSVVITQSAPGYYPYTLSCIGPNNNASLQTVVLTVYGSAPAVDNAPGYKTRQAAFTVAPPNQIVSMQTNFTVPPLPPAPADGNGTLFLWPGLAPGNNSANFLPINNGAMQAVMTWGTSCAPTSQPKPFSSWWVAGQYTNTYGSEPGHIGCNAGDSMLVSPGDVLQVDMALTLNTGVWTETITDSATNQSVAFDINMENQGQNWAYFVVVAAGNATIDTPVTFTDTTISFQTADTQGWCSSAQGENNAWVMTPPALDSSGTKCSIGTIVISDGATAPTPSIRSGGIVPVYSSSPTVQPGEWISIYGSNLATATATWNGDFPSSLGGTTVTINGKPAYLWLVSPNQINLQAPDDTQTGPVNVVVTTPTGSTTSTVNLASLAPSFSLLDSTHVTGIILRTDGSGAYGGGAYDIIGPTGNTLGYATVAAKAGDAIELFAVGLGPTNPAVPAGTAFSGSAPTTNALNLSINNVNVIPTYSGLTGAGLYQINLTVPAGLGTGGVPLVATVGGSQTQTGVVISLQ